MSNLTNYIDYFRQKAVMHYLLKHNPASENGDTTGADKAFAKWNLDEIVTGLRTKIGKRCMLLELYETDTAAAVPYDIKEHTTGAFTIMQKVPTGGTTLQEEEAYDTSLKIARDILRSVWQDHYGPNKNKCKTPFYEFYFDKINIQATPMMFDGYFGYRVEFHFKLQSEMNFMTPPEEGTFLNNYFVLGEPGDYLLADDRYMLAIFKQPN